MGWHRHSYLLPGRTIKFRIRTTVGEDSFTDGWRRGMVAVQTCPVWSGGVHHRLP